MRRPSLPAFGVLVAATLFAAFDYAGLPGRLLQMPFRNDVRLYFAAGRLCLRDCAHLYDPAAQAAAVHGLGPGAVWTPFANPPPLAALFAPLSLAPYEAVLWAWVLLMAACLVTAALIAAPGDPWSRAAHVLAALALWPAAFGISIGQVPAAVTLALAAGWLLSERGRPVLGGLCLSLLVLKPQVALLVPLALLVSGRWRLLAGWAAGTAAFAVLSLALLGPGGAAGYLHLLRLYPDLALGREFALTAIVPGGPAAAALEALVVVGTAAAAYRHRRASLGVTLAIGIAASRLALPYASFQDLTVLLLAGWLVLRETRAPAVWAFLALGYALAEFALAIGPAWIVLWQLALLAALGLSGSLPGLPAPTTVAARPDRELATAGPARP